MGTEGRTSGSWCDDPSGLLLLLGHRISCAPASSTAGELFVRNFGLANLSFGAKRFGRFRSGEEWEEELPRVLAVAALATWLCRGLGKVRAVPFSAFWAQDFCRIVVDYR